MVGWSGFIANSDGKSAESVDGQFVHLRVPQIGAIVEAV